MCSNAVASSATEHQRHLHAGWESDDSLRGKKGKNILEINRNDEENKKEREKEKNENGKILTFTNKWKLLKNKKEVEKEETKIGE